MVSTNHCPFKTCKHLETGDADWGWTEVGAAQKKDQHEVDAELTNKVSDSKEEGVGCAVAEVTVFGVRKRTLCVTGMVLYRNNM